MALGSKSVGEMSFDFEKAAFLNKEDFLQISNKHLFVSGLARSGTTALLRNLHQTRKFVSLTYADMPFVLAPNAWEKIKKGSSNTGLKERAHQDGIYIGDESPEALDEFFWKVFLDDNYIQKDRLVSIDIPGSVFEEYKKYIALILRKYHHDNNQRYLSKNNNNILRLKDILREFPESYIVIPFRNPLQQALSLLKQHNMFCDLQQKNSFVLDYMNWIGHHEFGLNQKPFYLKNDLVFDKMLQSDKRDVNFWLLSWVNYYTYVLANFVGNNCLFVSYENLCQNPESILKRVFQSLQLEDKGFDAEPFLPVERNCSEADPQILGECMEVYDQLIRIEQGRLRSSFP
jgi:hypothetical protein